MKMFFLKVAMFSTLSLALVLNSCKKDEVEKKEVLTEDTGIKEPSFNDSWGYLFAYTLAYPNSTSTTETEITYRISGLVSAVYFLPSLGSDKFDPNGGGSVYLNGTNQPNLYGSYIGSSVVSDKAEWSVSGNEKVSAFEDNNPTFVPVTGFIIPSWSKNTASEDLVITILGNTSNAHSVFIECESKPGVTYGDDKFLTKELKPGETTCTITASELQELKNHYKTGFTLKVEAFTAKKANADGKAYYMVNCTRLTHAVYFAQN